MIMQSDKVKSIGQWGEEQAAVYLKRKGCQIVERNFSCRFGEIDIIATDHDEIVFVEVKTRKNDSYAEAKEFVGAAKQRRILNAASIWLSKHHIELNPRFDVIEVYGEIGQPYRKLKINHLQNAFE